MTKGERVWEFHPVIDRVIPQADLLTLPAHVGSTIQKHAEFLPDAGVFRLAADGAFFMNHSDDPNLEDFGDWMIARKDIERGDEITCDYRIVTVWAFPVDAAYGSAGRPENRMRLETQK